MSIHSSLKGGDTMKRHRSVLTRLERVQRLHERGSLDLEGGSFLGLPKVKHLRIRIKKEKAAAAATEGQAPGTAAAAAPAQKVEAKKAPAVALAPQAQKAPEHKKAAEPKKKE